jgi:hypothetical protein
MSVSAGFDEATSTVTRHTPRAYSNAAAEPSPVEAAIVWDPAGRRLR